jgi:hypothetical protein
MKIQNSPICYIVIPIDVKQIVLKMRYFVIFAYLNLA